MRQNAQRINAFDHSVNLTNQREVDAFVVLKWVDALASPGLSSSSLFFSQSKKTKKRRRLTENEKVICDNMITFNGGSLGSCIDEERSQLRYVV